MKELPIGREALVNQVRQRMTGRLRLGLFKAGDRVPSVRVAAKELGLDPRIVLAAYQRLATEGVLELRRRSGVFVAAPKDVEAVPSLSFSRESEWLIDQFAHALESGIAAPSFPEYARRAFETLRLRAVVLDSNDDQLWSTADELERDYGFRTTAIDLSSIRAAQSLPLPLRRADVIVTASPSRSVSRLAKQSGVALLAVTMCPDLFAEVRRLLPSDHVYFVVSDARFARKLRSFLAPASGAAHFHALVYGRDDLGSIPKSAPLYLTRLTRKRMQHALESSDEERATSIEHQLLDRVLPEARVFSGDSARELIAFVVRANLTAQKPPLAGVANGGHAR